MFAHLDPGFHFSKVPYDAPWCQVEAARELTASLHFVNRRFSQGDNLTQFVAADGAPERKWAALGKLWQRLVGFRPRQGEKLVKGGVENIGYLR